MKIYLYLIKKIESCVGKVLCEIIKTQPNETGNISKKYKPLRGLIER
jgi:hypothetical protein